MNEKIYLKDIFRFNELLLQSEYKGYRIKLRFNKNWDDYSFVDDYISGSEDFLPWILSNGSDKKSRNRRNEIQFQFIEVEYHKWLFVGAYLIKEKNSQIKKVTYGNHHVKFALAERLKEYDKFIEKVLVNHTNTGQSWFYVNPKIIESVVVESVSSISYFNQTSQFPGYENISFSYQELKKNWANSSWRQYLSAVYGVYVITDAKTGKLYVGSAYGDNGVYGRWSTYLSEGYDKSEMEENRYPNKRLYEIVEKYGISYIKKYFQYS
ncbi:GIY-YIG nuclease family protein [Streptococcus infantis]|uniref:GIY-YIG nuclease family protein n=1 Tax=Streptococcus infantis TaxID=68892 RepID=UPI0039C358D1